MQKYRFGSGRLALLLTVLLVVAFMAVGVQAAGTPDATVTSVQDNFLATFTGVRDAVFVTVAGFFLAAAIAIKLIRRAKSA